MSLELATALRLRASRLTEKARLRFARIPFYRQLDANDCGIACLRMSLKFLGRSAHYKDVYESVQTRPQGVTAAALIRAAESFDLSAAAVRAKKETLQSISRGAILHCRPGHYVVLDGVTRDGTIRVLDPRIGRRTIQSADIDRVLSGIAIVLGNAEDRLANEGQTPCATEAPVNRTRSLCLRVLPGAILWTALHLMGLGIAASLVSLLDADVDESLTPMFFCWVALFSCEALRTIAIRRQCATEQVRNLQEGLKAVLRGADADAERQPVASSARPDRKLRSYAQIAGLVAKLTHQGICACGTFSILLFINPSLWMTTLAAGTIFVVNAARQAILRSELHDEAQAIEAAKGDSLAALSNVGSKTTAADPQVRRRCATQAARYEARYLNSESTNSPSDAMGWIWVLAFVIAGVWSIRSDAMSADPWIQSRAYFASLLSISTSWSIQQAFVANARLTAINGQLEYQESIDYVVSRKELWLQSVG